MYSFIYIVYTFDLLLLILEPGGISIVLKYQVLCGPFDFTYFWHATISGNLAGLTERQSRASSRTMALLAKVRRSGRMDASILDPSSKTACTSTASAKLELYINKTTTYVNIYIYIYMYM